MANTVRVGITATDEGFKSTLNQMEQSSNKFASSLNKGGKQASTFNGQLRSLRKEAVELAYAYDQLDEQAKNSDFGQSMKAQLQEVLNTAGQMQDIKGDVAEQIKNIASDTMMWDGMKEGIGVVSSGLQGLASIYGMLGGDTKEFTKALVAVNAVQSVANTIIGIGNALQKQSALMTMLRTAKEKLFGAAKAKNTALTITNTGATIAETGAMTAEAGATSTATAATWSFNAALAANPIGAVVVAVAALCAGIYALTQILSKATDEEEGLAEATQEVNNATQKSYEAYKKTELELRQYQKLVESFNGTAADEKRLVEQLNNELGNSLGKYKDLKSWKDALNTTSYYYCRVLQVEAKYNALAAAAAEAYAKAMSHEDYSKNMAKYRALEQEAEKELDNLNFLKRELARSQQLNPGYISSGSSNSGSSKGSKSSTKSTKDEKTAFEKLDEQIKKYEKELASLDKTTENSSQKIKELKNSIASLKIKRLNFIDKSSIDGLQEYKNGILDILKLYEEGSDEYNNVNNLLGTTNAEIIKMASEIAKTDDQLMLQNAKKAINEIIETVDTSSQTFQDAARVAGVLNKKISEIERVKGNAIIGVEMNSSTDLKQQLDNAIEELQDYANNTKIDISTAFDKGGFDEQYELLKKKAIELADAWTQQRTQFRGIEPPSVKPVDLTFNYKKSELDKINDQIQYQENLRDWYLGFDIQIDETTTFNKFQKSLDETRQKIKALKQEAITLEVKLDLEEAQKQLYSASWEGVKGLNSDLSGIYDSVLKIGEAFENTEDPIKSFFQAFDAINSIVDNILDLINLYEEINTALTAFNAVKATSNALDGQSGAAIMKQTAALGASTTAVTAEAAAETAAAAEKQVASEANKNLAMSALDLATANIAAAHSEIPFVGPALAAAGIATVMAAVATAHGTMMGLQTFAEGGIVGGSTTIGDRVLVAANKGEMYINTRQQKALFDFINGTMNTTQETSTPTVTTMRIKGADLYASLTNYGKITGKKF